MNEITVGGTVKVKFIGHPYEGVVISLSKKRFVVRFTTGSGRTREKTFRQDVYFATGVACSEPLRGAGAPVEYLPQVRVEGNFCRCGHPNCGWCA